MPFFSLRTRWTSGLLAGMALLPLLLAPALLTAQTPTWQPLGPFGGTVASLAVHPTAAGVLYASHDAGVLKSTDGGLSWRLLPGSPATSLVVLDPTRPATLYAVPRGLANTVYKSVDAGAHWTAVSQNLPDEVSITALTVDPARPVRLYLASANSGVWRSGDGGATWRPVNQGLPDEGLTATMVLAAVPRKPAGTAFVGSYGPGLFRTRNAGLSWERVQGGLPDARATALAVAPKDPRILYASFGGVLDSVGIYRSEDGGESWVPAGNPLGSGEVTPVRTLAVHPRLPFTVYAGTYRAIFKSTDGGRHWAPVTPPSAPDVLTLAFGAAPPVLYAGIAQGDALQGDDLRGGVLRSTDGGASWIRVNQGFPGVNSLAVAVDAAHPDTLVASAGPGIIRSADRGAHWTGQAHVGAPPEIVAAGPGTFYFVEGGSDFRRAVWKSTDTGLTWTGASIAFVQRTSLSADPLAPDTLYAIYNYYSGLDIHNDPSIYRSQDGGASWSLLADPPDKCSAFDIAVARTSSAPAVLYFSGAKPGSAECRASVWRSPDGGTTWTEAAAGLPGPATELVTDPRDTRVVYARLGNSILWRTTNAGASWQVSGLGQRAADELAVSPVTGAVWAASNGEVFRSTDLGATWTKRGDLAGIHGFAFAPSAPERVYAATSRGVWVLEDRP